MPKRIAVVHSALHLYGKIIAKIQKFCLLPIKNAVNFLKSIMYELFPFSGDNFSLLICYSFVIIV